MIGGALLRPSRLAPVRLYDGERLVWEAAASWRRVALDVFHVRAILLYFAMLLVANGVSAKLQGMSHAATLQATLPLVGALLLALLCVLALSHATWRSIRYTITTDRVVLRYGVALAGTLSIPHRAIAGVSLRVRPDHAGDVPLALHPSYQVNVLKTWPLVRPWHLRRAVPMLRGVPQAGVVASVLARHVAAAAATRAAEMMPALAEAAD